MQRTFLELTLYTMSIAWEEVRRGPEIHLQYNYKRTNKNKQSHYSYPNNHLLPPYYKYLKIIFGGDR